MPDHQQRTPNATLAASWLYGFPVVGSPDAQESLSQPRAITAGMLADAVI